MATLFNEMEAVLCEIVDKEVVKQFEKNSSLYNRVGKPHPWVGDVKKFAAMLDGSLLIPCRSFSMQGFPGREFYNCEICAAAAEARAKYQKSLRGVTGV